MDRKHKRNTQSHFTTSSGGKEYTGDCKKAPL